MTGNEYQKLSSRTINKLLTPSQQEKHAILGLVSEIGEVSGIYQKVYQGHNFDGKHVKSEVGDILWFIAELCTSRGWNLDDIMQANVNKLKDRYPDGFSVDKSLHRKAGDI